MFDSHFEAAILRDDASYRLQERSLFSMPVYNPSTHYIDLTRNKYFHALLTLRHYVRAVSDYYFSVMHEGRNIDLFMLTPSISSPMGAGSDSEAIAIKFGELDSYLVDSSQFGFEPLLLNGMPMVYCYLPSMRGEDADSRHLNQFFHCEAEIRGSIGQLFPLIEGYIKALCRALSLMNNIVEKISTNPKQTRNAINSITAAAAFPRVSFDQACELLREHGGKGITELATHRRTITAEGEMRLADLLKLDTPFWITNYDRDQVPFYLKPDRRHPEKAINADLIFPPLDGGCFGGEIVGCGERQDAADELIESLARQGICPRPYEWYIELRRQPNYSTTSGFGLGIERFLAWALCRTNIRDVIAYPRLKNIMTYP
ncbi:asparaginyl-tRNA synthetase [Bradyrhizobium japonicum]|uniref:amino acid--tRNA ligase-related protein n=1 Tax=Bradyrhizobium elkanii TaxID=29448 RepID=UPI00037E1A08|nr:amino acid--tRNA ligase-related protein [Bradyrhizobium elkanii]MBP2435053.1 asparaginyl-tRNA synthetase [Bradyrhizobium elkanii]MCP1737772.1 asparaginyl-tRNA synthetase [Bradyrhizobium elkanii]MCS3575931.1 asparaginyl-tRNA synthetase [Bradyrhizobium elkanii]MCS3594731.1 asparaginyl-tRNA synthetase [Bradyrhizobium elkanii]MCS3625925.1 asparaginyl-tRNA synthetase [Bradyrhizobium elkanii]